MPKVVTAKVAARFVGLSESTLAGTNQTTGDVRSSVANGVNRT
jgi:hypothetical protein